MKDWQQLILFSVFLFSRCVYVVHALQHFVLSDVCACVRTYVCAYILIFIIGLTTTFAWCIPSVTLIRVYVAVVGTCNMCMCCM